MPAIIGITTYGTKETTVLSDGIDAFYAIPSAYVSAVRRAGGTPILLPPGEPDPTRWLDLCDGVLFSGGADISPTRYGGDPNHPKLGPVDQERDKTEFDILQILINSPKPLLLICRGLQLLNVFQGGTLHPHIADKYPDNIHQGKDTIWTMQKVSLQSGDALTAMSGHHQGIDMLGRDLAIDATAKDGIIEAITLTSHPYCKAVQWHPEMTAHNDPAQQAIFDEFIRESELRR